MQDISGFGLRVNILTTVTFPLGINITNFADDNDPFDFPSMQIGDSAMGLNGDLIIWSKANPIKVTLSVVPQSVDDELLSILFQANRVGKGKANVRDIITMTGIYPSGQIVVLNNGFITDGMPGTGVASAGRLKSKTYNFSFENGVAT